MIFCTLFNKAYLPQGIALYRSLQKHAAAEFELHVLCMDQETADILRALQFPHVKIIGLSEIENDQMKAIKAARSIGEYCWTCTTPLLLYVMDRCAPNVVVTYVDADIAFFSDPAAILAELGSGSIYIHEHDFAPRYATLETSAGRFNVGVSAFRNNEEGRACLTLWKAQCLDECVMDFSVGKCGDQNYLDDWPRLYAGLVIASSPGIGLGPWNVESRKIDRDATADGVPAVFYHYHSMKLLSPKWLLRAAILSGWFEIPAAAITAFYEPYARDLWRAVDDVARLGLKLEFQQLPDRYDEMPFHQLVLLAGSIQVSGPWVSKVFDRIV